MAMSETMLWRIDRNSSIDGQWNTKLNSQFGTTTEIALHKPLILCPSFLSHTQRIHLLPKRRKEDSLEPSRQPTNPQTKRRQAVFDGLRFLDSRVGTLARLRQVCKSFFFCHILSYLLCREACIVFKPGKNCDGYFDADKLIAQVDRAIDIFEGKTNRHAQGLFMFDNAPSHLKRAPDALSARKMVKSVQFFFHFLLSLLLMCPRDPKRVWSHHPNGPRMRDGINPKTKQPQSFYFPEDHPKYPGWFKGMEQIICKCGLWPEDGLSVECSGPKCPEGQANCCCCHLLYRDTQSNFMSQKPLL